MREMRLRSRTGDNVLAAIAAAARLDEGIIGAVRRLGIIVNLITNAKDAVVESSSTKREVRVSTRLDGREMVVIEVSDSGVGIAPDDMVRIFSYGFTTKVDGHGFGLHRSALIAREMGGGVRVKSEGIGMGATFQLEVPLSGESSQKAELAA